MQSAGVSEESQGRAQSEGEQSWAARGGKMTSLLLERLLGRIYWKAAIFS